MSGSFCPNCGGKDVTLYEYESDDGWEPAFWHCFTCDFEWGVLCEA